MRTSAAIGAETPGFLTEVPGPPPSLAGIYDPLPDRCGHRLDAGPDAEFGAGLLEIAVDPSAATARIVPMSVKLPDSPSRDTPVTLG